MSDRLHLLQLVTVRWYNACAEYAVRLAAGLAARGHRVVVGGFPGSPPLVRARELGLPVIDAFDFRPGRLDAPRTLLRFRGYLRQNRFDLVNAHRSEDHLFAALALGPRRRAPLVRTRGDVRPPRRHFANRLLYESLTDAHVLAADFMRHRFYDGFRILSERLVTIRPGIDAAAWCAGAPHRQAARNRLGFPPEAQMIGLIGRLTAAKGHAVAIEAFARIAHHFPGARLVLAGETYEVGPDRLEEQIRRRGLEGSVILMGRLPDVRLVMAALDLAVVASTASEAICRVALEYQALGLPVIGSDLNSIPEIVANDRTGLIVPPGDPAALAGAMETLLLDPGLAARLGAAASDNIRRHHGLEAFLDRTEALYRQLVETRQ